MKYGLLLAWMIVVVACNGAIGPTASTIDPAPLTTPTPTVSAPIERDQLQEARTRWSSVDRPWYRYTYRRFCECDMDTAGPNEVLVEVEGVREVWYLGTGDVEVPRLQASTLGWSIPELFQMIEESLDAGVQIEVTYANEGYPTRLSLDLEAMAVDGGFSLEILAFDDPVDELIRVASARALWAGAAIGSYSFRFQAASFAASGYDVVVTGTEVFVDGEYGWGPTSIDEAFDLIEETILAAPDAFSAEYDPVTGVPLRYDVDYEELAIDDEVSARITGFTIILVEG